MPNMVSGDDLGPFVKQEADWVDDVRDVSLRVARAPGGGWLGGKVQQVMKTAKQKMFKQAKKGHSTLLLKKPKKIMIPQSQARLKKILKPCPLNTAHVSPPVADSAEPTGTAQRRAIGAKEDGKDATSNGPEVPLSPPAITTVKGLEVKVGDRLRTRCASMWRAF